MHMPLTPDANLCCVSAVRLLVEAVVEWATYSTSSSACTLLIPCTRAIPSLHPIVSFTPSLESCSVGAGGGGGVSVPDGQDATGLGETRLLLHTSDSLLENGGNLGGCGFGVDSIRPELVGCGVENSWRGSGLGRRKNCQCSVAAQELPCQCDSRQQARRPQLWSSSIEALGSGRKPRAGCSRPRGRMLDGWSGPTDAILPGPAIAPTARGAWRRAFLNIVDIVCVLKGRC